MTHTIYAYKLLSGEEIIGRLVSSSPEGTITLSHIRMISMVPNNKGQVGVALVPYMVSGGVDGDFMLFSSAVAGAPSKIDETIEKMYMQQTTGIALGTL